MSAADQPTRLAPATRLGPYEIVGPLGRGGMGEVYRARDTRLEREVAIKLLPPELAGDEQFKVRFEREAKAVSALNHPHICTLHDVGQETLGEERLHFLVLELIEGESLAERIGQGPLSLDEVLLYGKQVASALDAAHRRGIVHRDLKPGNVMITRTGAKLVDFGLARAGDGGMADRLSTLETAARPLTEQGTILGTYQYMAPEQLEGAVADARTDIFALGALLYEMATGRRAFEGKNRTSLIAAIVSSQPPPISAVQGMSPPALDHVVRKCLEKDPDDRWQSARDVMAELQWIAEGGSRAGLPALVATRRRVREGLAWSISAILALAAVGLGIAWARRAPSPLPVVRFTVANPEGVTAIGPPVASPDGRFIAFDAADTGGKRQIWLRPMDSLEARPLAGSEGVVRPFWSPDSRFVAFVSGGKLRKLAVTGGPAQTICDAPTGADGSWSPNGVILFDGTDTDPIHRVDAAGGVAKVAVSVVPDKGVSSVGWPEFLPDGRHYLYMIGAQSDDRTLMVGELDSTESKPLFKTMSRVVYAPPGYLLYVREQTLVAQPFDAAKQKLAGEPVPLGEGLGIDNVGGASFSVSSSGALAFRAGETQGRRLVWMDRNGKETPALDEAKNYVDTGLSPDGKRLAFDVTEPGGKGDIWIRDLARGVTSRFTFDPESEFGPTWSPDGRKIVFSKQAKAWDLFVKDAAGTGEPEPLLQNDENKYVTDWTRDGKYVIYASNNKDTSWDLWALPVSGERKPLPLVRTKFAEHGGVVSPDGRFLAYRSNESGRSEVYVQEFPEARSKWQVSAEGGFDPFWRADGREIYYRGRDTRLMVVSVETGAAFSTGTPQPLFQARFASIAARGLYRATPDGQRFLVLAPLGRDALPPTTVVLNWLAAIEQ
ncbi:MAG: protein kinase [Vicinamibacteria bacterium]